MTKINNISFKYIFVFFTMFELLLANNFKNNINIQILKSQIFKVNKKNKIIITNNNSHAFCYQIKKEIKKIYNSPYIGENGKVLFQITITPEHGIVSDYLLYENKGNKPFKKHIDNFFKKLLRTKILYGIDYKVYQFKILISIKSYKNIEDINKLLLMGKNFYIQNPYKKYLIYLILYKHYSKQKIKKLLSSNNITITKAMLYYLYFTYNKPNIKYSTYYYDKLINYKSKIKGKIESIFLIDHLIKNKNFFNIVYLIPNGFCKTITDFKLQNACYYYQGFGKYMNNFDNFLMPLEKASDIENAQFFLKIIGYR